MKYTDPDGRHTWEKSESEYDEHYNSLYDPNMRNCPAVFSTDINHYIMVAHSGILDNHKYSISGTKDEIELRTGDILAQTITKVTLKRFNVIIDGKSYDVFSLKGKSNTRLFFTTDTQEIESLFIAIDNKSDNYSIFNGFFNRDNIVNYLNQNDANNLAKSVITFGLTSKMDPFSANFTEGLLNYLSSMNGGNIPQTNGIDKKTLDLINQIIAESEKE